MRGPESREQKCAYMKVYVRARSPIIMERDIGMVKKKRDKIGMGYYECICCCYIYIVHCFISICLTITHHSCVQDKIEIVRVVLGQVVTVEMKKQ